MAYYGHCESYFVEGHDDNERRYRDDMRERKRFTNQQIQHELGADLSKLTSYEYGAEILQQMEKVEVSNSVMKRGKIYHLLIFQPGRIIT